MRAWSYALMAVTVLCLSGCGYNTLQQKDEGVKAAWSEVVLSLIHISEPTRH